MRQHRSLEATIFSEDSGEERTLEVVFEPATQDVFDGGRVDERRHSEASKMARTTMHKIMVKKTTTVPRTTVT
jgi:hypothetical protein